MWKVSSGERIKILAGHSGPVLSVVFSGDGEYLASGSWDKTIRLWRVSSGESIKTFTGNFGLIYSVAFSENGNYLASGAWG